MRAACRAFGCVGAAVHRTAVAIGVNRRYPLEDDGLCVLQHLLDRGIAGENAAQSVLAERNHS